jgi:hypothetical protein
MSEPPDAVPVPRNSVARSPRHVILKPPRYPYADAHDAGSDLRRVRLHPYESELSGFVDALRELRHLLVLPGLPQALHDRLVRDLIDAAPSTKATSTAPAAKSQQKS